MEEPKSKNALEKVAYALERIVYPLSKGIAVVSAATLVIMMFLTTIDVIMRRFFNQPIFGAYEISKVLLAIAIFCGVAYVMVKGGHVNVDIATRLYPRRLKLAVYSIGLFLSLVIVGLISWQAALYGIDMVQVGERSVLLRIVVFPFIFVVAFGSAVLFLVILVQFLYALGGKLDGTG